jgi:cytochrome b subunit of formate dehydrogenase
MQEQQQPNRGEFVVRFGVSALDETGGVLKLYFTLTTGAVILFVCLLAAAESPRIVLLPLAVSVIAFAIAATHCLHVLIALIDFRILVLGAVASDASESEVERKITDWSAEAGKVAKQMERLFRVGLVFAAIFVIAAIVWR